jgi:hypothetical protein
VQVALTSARERAPNIFPVVVVVGEMDGGVVRSLEDLGAKVIFHEHSFMEQLMELATLPKYHHTVKS